MAAIKGIKERVHYPIYDAVVIPEPESTGNGGKALSFLTGGIHRFFMDVSGRSKLLTNMTAAGVLPHYNTFEVRAIRVAIAGGYRSPKLEDEENPKQPHPVLANDALTRGIIFGSITSLFVGEKVMIQHPTFFFPAGGGVAGVPGDPPGAAPRPGVGANGATSPADTFRLAEPIQIERQQNFRVEIEFPDREDPILSEELCDIHGPARIWVTLDGFLERSVQ